MRELLIADDVDTGSPTFTWNYRRARLIDDDREIYFGIVEAYYDDGVLVGWNEEGQIAYGEDLEQLETDFEFMKEAFDRPVLDTITLAKTLENRGPGEEV